MNSFKVEATRAEQLDRLADLGVVSIKSDQKQLKEEVVGAANHRFFIILDLFEVGQLSSLHLRDHGPVLPQHLVLLVSAVRQNVAVIRVQLQGLHQDVEDGRLLRALVPQEVFSPAQAPHSTCVRDETRVLRTRFVHHLQALVGLVVCGALGGVRGSALRGGRLRDRGSVEEADLLDRRQ